MGFRKTLSPDTRVQLKYYRQNCVSGIVEDSKHHTTYLSPNTLNFIPRVTNFALRAGEARSAKKFAPSGRAIERAIERSSERASERAIERASERSSEWAREVFFNISGYTSYTSIYFHIPSYTLNIIHILSYTLIYPIYFKIPNIRKMRLDIRPQNAHKTSPRASPMARIWHAPSYYIPRRFCMPKAIQFDLK